MLDIRNIDCMELMAQFEDKYFDLAIVDPPYGISMDGGKIGGNNLGKAKDYTKKDWDKEAPPIEYFNELIRVSKNQIVFGANHFISKMPFDSSCWIVWDKDNSGNFADCELAWTSFNTAVRKVKRRWNGMLQHDMKNKETRIHQTQKPVVLYNWILSEYAKQGMKILDTHLGSGSIAVSCHYAGLDLTASEIDTEYYKNAMERIKNETAQLELSFNH